MPRFHGSDAVAPLKRFAHLVRGRAATRFHGSDAVAPLKRFAHLVRGRAATRFHGSDAVAPLKPATSGSPVVRLMAIPRLRCRGPIEAVPRMVGTIPPPGSIPRLRCRGPIEAAKQLDVTQETAEDSTAQMPWPH